MSWSAGDDDISANMNEATLTLNDRTSRILEAAIQEFIETGEPVSSGLLYKKHDFGIKPAMIRLELDDLEADGYLEQPYHSAGRVPTDRGYEFYAERVLLAEADRLREVARRHAVAASRAAARSATLRHFVERRAWGELATALSAELGLLSVAVDQKEDAVYKTGLEALIDNLQWEDREELRSVIHDFESVDERLPRAAEKMLGKNRDRDDAQTKVFIGKKSPVTESSNLSVVCRTYDVGGETVAIFAIGPKRMDYKKVIQILKNL